MSHNRIRLPKSQFGRTLLSLAVTAAVGFGYFYVTLPALNPHAGEFYSFLGLLCAVYVVCVFLLSGAPHDNVIRTPKEKLHEWLKFIKSRCLPVGLLFVAVVVIAAVGNVVSMPLLRAAAYRDLLTVQTGDFASDVAQISFNEIPTLDRTSAEFLGDRQMGTLSDMVSQFEYSGDSTQINYQGRPVRVAPIAYADLFKWLTNRSQGLPAYVVVDMVTQEATVTRLPQGMKYSFSEPLNRNIVRHLRFHYPTMMFSTPEELPKTQASGTIAEIRSAVLSGSTYYFLRLEGETVFYALSAAQDRQAVTLNVGDRITLDHALPGEEETDILDAYALTIDGRGSSQTVAPDLAAG